MQFTIAGKRVILTRQKIESKMRGILPEQVRKHWVRLGGKRYPVKQVIAGTANLSRADINSHEAVRILKRLGLPVFSSDTSAGR